MLNNDSNGHTFKKRVVFTTGGKGGVGKTSVTLAIADWYQSRQITFLPLDLDTENKALGSLRHYFPQVQKVNIQTDAGLDIFLSILADGQADIILADMGGGAGLVTYQWFQFMKDDFSPLGISFTAVGVITPDPASVESVLTWASNLEDRVQYLIVENSNTSNPDFTYWHQSKQAQAFRNSLIPSSSLWNSASPNSNESLASTALLFARSARDPRPSPPSSKSLTSSEPSGTPSDLLLNLMPQKTSSCHLLFPNLYERDT